MKLSMKNTKQELLNALQEGEKNVVQIRTTQGIKPESPAPAPGDVTVRVRKLRDDMISKLSWYEDECARAAMDLEAIHKVIKEAHSIDVNAATLQALLDSQNVVREKCNREMAEAQAYHDNLMREKKQAWKVEKETYDYELLKRRRGQDAEYDQKINERMDELVSKEKTAEKLMAQAQLLLKKAGSFDERVDVEVKKQVETYQISDKQFMELEFRKAEIEKDNEINRLIALLEVRESSIETLKETLFESKQLINEANKNAKEIATTALKGNKIDFNPASFTNNKGN